MKKHQRTTEVSECFSRKIIRGRRKYQIGRRQKYQRATEERATEVSEGDRSIRTEVSEGDRSIRG